MKFLNFIGIIMMTLMLGFLIGVGAENYGLSTDTTTLLGFAAGLFLPIILVKILYPKPD